MSVYQPPKNGFRTFLIVWGTQSISVLGSALTFFCLTIWLSQVLYSAPEQKSDLAFALTAVSLAFGLPAIFGAPLAGAWADRHDRKRTMMAMDLLNGLISLALVALIAVDKLSLWAMLFLVAVSSLVKAFHNAAFDTSYAMLVPEAQLPRANGMMQTMWALSAILAPAIAAVIISLPALARQGKIGGIIGSFLAGFQTGIPLAIMIDAFTFFFAAYALIFVFIPSPRRVDLSNEGGQPKPTIWADVRVGIVFILKRYPMLWLLATFTVINFSAGAFVLQPVLVKFNLAPDWTELGFTYETALALLVTISSIGGLVGGIIISTWGGLKKHRIYGVVLPILALSLLMIVFGLSPLIYLTALAAFFIDALIPIMDSHSQAIWQAQTPHELQGRVFSVRRLIAQFSWPLGVAVSGALGGIINPGWVFAGLGLFGALFSAAMLFNPYLLKIEDKAYLDQLASQ
jgi:DHA3 family macrolide efflux protein-like MFS transporter